MKWLQYSQYDLAHGLGGVEVHARCLHRELTALGVESVLSRDVQDLQKNWDVIHTHGSAGLSHRPSHARDTILLHTFHGTTIGRMAACGEWTWPGGYLAYLRELRSLILSDLSLLVHPGLHFKVLSKFLQKPTVVCWNGWDSWKSSDRQIELKTELKTEPYFVFNAREEDPVKNSQFVKRVFDYAEGPKLVRIPTDTGPQTSEQVRQLLVGSKGLVLASHYEGLPIVVLEALALGIPVITTGAGGQEWLSPQIRGLWIEPLQVESWRRILEELKSKKPTIGSQNQAYLPSWKNVAQTALEAVHDFKKNSGKLITHAK